MRIAVGRMFHVLLMCGCLASFSASPSRADSLLQKRFLAEAPRAWGELKTFSMTLQGKASQVMTWPSAGNPPRRFLADFNGSRGSLKWHCTTYDGDVVDYDEVICVNPVYGFQLTRKRTSWPWRVDDVATEKTHLLAIARAEIFPSLLLARTEVDWLVKQPGFTLTAVESVKQNEDGLVRVRFRNASFKKSDYKIQSGWFMLDPVMHWAVKEFQIEVKYLDGKGITLGRTEYANKMLSGFPVVRRRVVESKVTADAPVIYRNVLDLTNVKPGTVSDEDCRLPAFGFPPPGEMRTQSRSLWLFLLGSVGLAIAVFLAYLARRRRSAKQP